MSLWLIFGNLRRRRTTEHWGGGDILWEVYQRGYEARVAGQPCEPPAGHDGMLGVDLLCGWIAGWEQADREFGGS